MASERWFANVANSFQLRVEHSPDDPSLWIAHVLRDPPESRTKYWDVLRYEEHSEQAAKQSAEAVLRSTYGREFGHRLDKINWEKSEVSDEAWEKGFQRFVEP